MLYCHAILPKAGLGNRLFPWARCRVFSSENNVPMLSPTWAQLRMGPLLRGESDLRHYANLFTAGPDEITSIKKLFIKCISRWEHEDDAGFATFSVSNGRTVIRVFDGEQDRFQQLNGWHELLRAKLLAITRPRWRNAAEQIRDVPIGIHVRMGDFVESGTDPANPHVRAPRSWYVKSLREIRKAAGYPVRAILVSDGKENELEELLAEKNISLVRTGSAIGDLLLLSKSKVLIASAGSSFSAWAAFLGQMPSIAHPSQSFEWFNLINQNGNYVGGFDPLEPDEMFLRQVGVVFGSTEAKAYSLAFE